MAISIRACSASRKPRRGRRGDEGRTKGGRDRYLQGRTEGGRREDKGDDNRDIALKAAEQLVYTRAGSSDRRYDQGDDCARGFVLNSLVDGFIEGGCDRVAVFDRGSIAAKLLLLRLRHRFHSAGPASDVQFPRCPGAGADRRCARRGSRSAATGVGAAAALGPRLWLNTPHPRVGHGGH